ncbi:hypothetical protein BU15DRAFT_27402, partial [Melanogaster broomeanus]
PSEWLPLTHPEGALYFYHIQQRIFTDADIREPEIEQKITSYADKLRLWARHRLVDSDSTDIELALELYNDENSKTHCRYYYVDHQKRVLFWAHRFNLPTENVKGVRDLSHVKYAVEAEYWLHCELFPNLRYLPKQAPASQNHLAGVVADSSFTEVFTSDTSLSPFGKEEISAISSLLDNIQSMERMSVFLIFSLIQISRWPEGFPPGLTKVKFVNWYGQPTARLDADQSIYATTSSHQRVSLLLRMLNPFLFRSPEAHLRTIRRMWVDEMVVQPRWKNFIDLLNKEWNQFTIFATVILAVDVSFLAVPGVLNTPSQSTSATSLSQSPAAIGVFLSTLCAVGSLLVSVILSGQVNNQSRDSAEGVAHFMTGMTDSMLKRDSLAILHSLPFALLLWGYVAFI